MFQVSWQNEIYPQQTFFLNIFLLRQYLYISQLYNTSCFPRINNERVQNAFTSRWTRL